MARGSNQAFHLRTCWEHVDAALFLRRVRLKCFMSAVILLLDGRGKNP
jgi:hypothetical protein